MRILKFFFVSLLVVGVLGALGFFISREILLSLGVSQVKNSLKSLRKVSASGQYVAQCIKLGGDFSSGSNEVRAQLRFETDRDYILEVVCLNYPSNPIEINVESLPTLVKKQAGKSGIIWDAPLSGIVLEIWGRRTTVLVEDREIKTSPGAIDFANLGSDPEANCQGFGFSCCDDYAEEGVGYQLTGAKDCPKTCFAQCLNRPLVLSFTSQPLFDDKTKREITLTKGGTVKFFYVAGGTKHDAFGEASESNLQIFQAVLKQFQQVFEDSSPTPNVFAVNLDFGDGQRQNFEETSNNVEHVYDCKKDRCVYTAQLVVTENGLSSKLTPISQIRVVVE